jgi:putative DNA primase/helicase
MELTWPDREIREYVQRAFGYTLQGTQAERCFFLLYGDGRNGKFITLRVIEMVLGSTAHGYAQQVNASYFSRSSNSDIQSGVAKLRGVRPATVGEFPNRNMNAELIKTVTGGESNTSRQLYERTAEFPFQCKLWFSSNNKPGPTDATAQAFWDRMYPIPCTAVFPNPDEPGNISEAVLMEQFRAEASGILNWMLEGHRMWRESGLMVPKSLKEEREEYRRSLDILEEFLNEDGVTVHPHYKEFPDDVGFTKLTVVWKVFQPWAERNGYKNRNQCRTSRELGDTLRKKGFRVASPYASPKNPYSGQLFVYGLGISDISIMA